jgi:glycine cleavage system H protein
MYIPEELKYRDSHEWIHKEKDDIYTVGITEYAQDLLGDIVFIDLPNIGTIIASGDECAVIESVKAASDIYAPISGEIILVNYELNDRPELINTDPYKLGWLFKVKSHDQLEANALLDPNSYRKSIEG